MEDPRFVHIPSDPRFKGVPRKKRKVSVDSRFKTMFTDERFKVNYYTDKRGSNRLQQSSSENLKKYYNLSEDEEMSDGALIGKEGEEEGEEEEKEEEKGEEEEEESVESDSSTDIEDEDALISLTANGVFSDWLDQTEAVEQSDESGHRLAVCNMNWDRIQAIDLYALFNSFRPSGGVVKSVAIYLSDFGRERLKEEELKGPEELVQDTPTEEDPTNDEKDNSKISKLREYQLKRLQYYYAVIECDSTSTAEHLYNECDGLEFELSSSTLDLRFIPDNMSFNEHQPTSFANESSLTKDYQPPQFVTTALQQSNVQLTWDETHPSRLKTTMKRHDKNNIIDDNFNNLIGSSSDEEEEEGVESVDKYRSLLGLSKNSLKEKEENEEELEITWNIGLNEDGNSLKRKGKNDDSVKAKSNEREEGEEKDLGFDDPFFTQKSSRKRKKKLSKEEQERIQKEKEDLELLVLSDTEDTREHFSLSQILKDEKKESSKKKRRERKDKKKSSKDSTDYNFKLDLNDPRFSSLYTSHHYAIEPSNPQYKATKGMKSLLNERQRRRNEREFHDDTRDSNTTTTGSTDGDSTSLQMLIKSVKSKANKKTSKQLLQRSLKVN